MNVRDFTYLLQNPNEVISSDQTNQLSDILSEFPYFQAARALHLKGLKNLNSFKYNNALKIAAAHTTDRDILFDFITSQEFLQNTIANTLTKNTTEVTKKTLLSHEETKTPLKGSEPQKIPTKKSFTTVPKQNPEATDQKANAELSLAKEEHIKTQNEEAQDLKLGQPIAFTKKEKYSFAEWLKVASASTIDRKNESKHENDSSDFELEKKVLKQKKLALIDKFISDRPKIVPNQNTNFKVNTKESAKFEDKELMTETLAKVYLEQKKYKNAIQAYRILSLKYPEKSGFFADRIKSVEKIQQENS